jgi:hypothetical protein
VIKIKQIIINKFWRHQMRKKELINKIKSQEDNIKKLSYEKESAFNKINLLTKQVVSEMKQSQEYKDKYLKMLDVNINLAKQLEKSLIKE